MSQHSTAMTINDYKITIAKSSHNKLLKMYVVGLVEGINYTDGYNLYRGIKPIFCPPKDLVINAKLALSIIDVAINSSRYKNDEKIPVVLIREFQIKYPCTEK